MIPFTSLRLQAVSYTHLDVYKRQDEATARWKQEGKAGKTGAMYVAKVSHFSFWNLSLIHISLYPVLSQRKWN